MRCLCFSLEDALGILVKRGQLISQLPESKMIAVHASEEDLRNILDEGVWISVINSKNICNVSGDFISIDKFILKLDKLNIKYSNINISHGFHSELMKPILGEFFDYISSIKLNSPKIPYLSNITGFWITNEQATSAEYWTSHIIKPVNFLKCLQTIEDSRDFIMLEVGPNNNLIKLAKIYFNDGGENYYSTIISSRERVNNIYITLGKLWEKGVSINWESFNFGKECRKVELPGYTFDKKRFWIDKEQKQDLIHKELYKLKDVRDWFHLPSWKRKEIVGTDEYIYSENYINIVFINKGVFSEFFKEYFSTNFDNCIIVDHGSDFNGINSSSISIDYLNSNHYENLFEEIYHSNLIVRNITFINNFDGGMT